MTYDELKENLMEFFGDRSRSAAETKDGLEGIAEEALLLASSIQTEDVADPDQ